MYGLVNKLNAVPGKRDALVSILVGAATRLPGCLSYIVAKDSGDENGIWVTEVWESRQSHEASLALPIVRQAIEQGRPLVACFGQRAETEPAGGHGLVTCVGCE